MTFLELTRRLASESGTVSGDNRPASVAGNTGRLAKLPRWVADAWRDIQNEEDQWRWMIAEGTLTTYEGVDSYSGSGLTRFGDWIVDRRSQRDSGITIYKLLGDEAPLMWLDWATFRRVALRGDRANDKPAYVSIDPQDKLRLSPAPDGAYTIRFEYRKSPQELELDADIPEMPVRFHPIIVDRALDYLGTDDESGGQMPLWSMRARMKMTALRRDQLQEMGFAGSMA